MLTAYDALPAIAQRGEQRYLTETLERDELVVFAGAGISLRTPANLSNLKASRRPFLRGPAKRSTRANPWDRFMGWLKLRGTSVHERAADALCEGTPEPTALQDDLLRLCGTPQSVQSRLGGFAERVERENRERLRSYRERSRIRKEKGSDTSQLGSG